jgi:enhancing lycopene biosynthesis protein 2
MCGFLLALIEQERPMGFICISPAIVTKYVLTDAQLVLCSFQFTCNLSVNYRKDFK